MQATVHLVDGVPGPQDNSWVDAVLTHLDRPAGALVARPMGLGPGRSWRSAPPRRPGSPPDRSPPAPAPRTRSSSSGPGAASGPARYLQLTTFTGRSPQWCAAFDRSNAERIWPAVQNAARTDRHARRVHFGRWQGRPDAGRVGRDAGGRRGRDPVHRAAAVGEAGVPDRPGRPGDRCGCCTPTCRPPRRAPDPPTFGRTPSRKHDPDSAQPAIRRARRRADRRHHRRTRRTHDDDHDRDRAADGTWTVRRPTRGRRSRPATSASERSPARWDRPRHGHRDRRPAGRGRGRADRRLGRDRDRAAGRAPARAELLRRRPAPVHRAAGAAVRAGRGRLDRAGDAHRRRRRDPGDPARAAAAGPRGRARSRSGSPASSTGPPLGCAHRGSWSATGLRWRPS